MTTYLEVKQWTQNAVGDADGTLIVAADLMRYANAAQREICRKMRLLNKIIAGAQTLTNFDLYGGLLMPADFLIEDEVYYAYGGGTLQRLGRLPWDTLWLSGLPAAGTAGQPTSYSLSDYLTGSQIGQRHMVFYPFMPPGLTGQIVRIAYNAAPPAITADGDVLQIPDHMLELMAWKMQASCRIQLDDFVGAQSMIKMYNERLIELGSEFMDTSGLQNRTIVSDSDPVVMAWEY